jgi:lipopolysaccharide transport system ATP-binding protein
MNNEPIQSVAFNQEVKIRIHVEALVVQSFSVQFIILDDKKIKLTGCGFAQVEQELLSSEPGGLYLVEYALRLPLNEGNYALRIQIAAPLMREETSEFLDVIEDAIVFQMLRWERSRIWSKIHLFPTLKIKKLT